MSLPNGKISRPAPLREQADDEALNIAVVFTSPEATSESLKEAGWLARGLTARITLVALQVVPYPRSIDDPPVAAAFTENRLLAIAAGSGVDASVRIYLCRDRIETLMSVLEPDSIVILGWRRIAWLPFWPSKTERLARRLQQRSCQVLFLKTS